jgi:hypothetical protein
VRARSEDPRRISASVDPRVERVALEYLERVTGTMLTATLEEALR